MNLPFSPELQLMLVAALFYVWDASVLLYVDEALLMPRPKGRWVVGLARTGLQVRGRFLLFPQILWPNRPAWRFRWDPMQFEVGDTFNEQPVRRRPWPAAASLAVTAGVLIFVMLPACLWVVRSDLNLLVCAAAIYANCLAAAAWVLARRKVLGLTRSQAVSLATECVLCPPLTVSLVKRLALRAPPHVSLLATARARLDDAAWQDLRQDWLASIADELQETDDAQRRAALVRAREYVKGPLP